MKSEKIDLQPVQQLLNKHIQHMEPYEIEFRGFRLLLHPEVFNPAYTRVSGFLMDNIEIRPNESCLEMFSGCGALAFIAGQYASRVVGVEISPIAVEYSRINTQRLGLNEKVFFRQGSMWSALDPDEKFDVIFANPPLLPVEPESLLEMAVADSPEMRLTQEFIRGAARHLTEGGSRIYMAFSNACEPYVGDPLAFISQLSNAADLDMRVKAEWDVGYEVYRVLEFHPKQLLTSLLTSNKQECDNQSPGLFIPTDF